MSDRNSADGQTPPLGFGVADMAVVRTMSGLDFIRGIAAGSFPAPTISRTLNYSMQEAGEGWVIFTGIPTAEFLNPIGTVHGGYAATLLDSALACAVHTICPVGHASTSVELKINFVRPITPKTGRLFARGDVVHPGRQLATAEARLTDENGKLYAHGTQTCSIFRLPGA